MYTADPGVSNSSGVFSKEDLAIAPGVLTFVTATAVLSNGAILEEATVIAAPFISARH